MNDSRVIPSRLLGRTATGAAVEIFLLESLSAPGAARWRALAKPLKKLRDGAVVAFDGGLSARVLEREDVPSDGTPTVVLELDRSDAELLPWLERYGYVPLPPYIRRDDPAPAGRSKDKDRYQTVYARAHGSVAAPTAGLHFTPELLQALEGAGHEVRRVQLHVGAGTFLPVKSDDVERHVMHAERTMVPRETLTAILEAKRAGRKVVAIGTTSFRALESLAGAAHGDVAAMAAACDAWRSTDLFIRPRADAPRYRPHLVDGLFTNFHQPRSTLFMLVAALIGLDEAQELYGRAIADGYRLFSYGDASLLWI